MSSLRPLLRIARLVFTPLSLLVIAWLVWDARAALAAVVSEGAWGRLLLALALWICSNVFAPLVTVFMFRCCALQIAYGDALRIHVQRLPAKYLPGGIWHSVGRANDYVQMGYPGLRLGTLFILENCLLVLVTVCLSAALVVGLVTLPWLRALLQLATPLAAAGLLLLPVVFRRFAGLKDAAVAPYFATALLLALYWIIAGSAFVIFLGSFPQQELQATPVQAGGVYVLSWVIGYLALFAPQGIGVAEFVSGTLLGEGGATGTIVGILVGFRLLVLVADLLSWGAQQVLARIQS